MDRDDLFARRTLADMGDVWWWGRDGGERIWMTYIGWGCEIRWERRSRSSVERDE